MDLLKLEIERKRKELTEASLLGNEKKFFKRGELEEIKTKQFLEKLSEKQKTNGDNSDDGGVIRSHHMSKLEKLKQSNLEKEESEKKPIPKNEVIRRLRERCEPIRLFGETDQDVLRRLNIIETTDPKENGMRNDFREAMEKSEQECLNEIMNIVDADKSTTSTEIQIKDDGINFNEIIELSKNNREKNNDSLFVLKYIKYLVKKWGQYLNSRQLNEKLTVKGKIETALHSQTVSYLKPLCRKLKSKTLPSDILDSLVNIFLHVMDRNYIKANEYFLEMAIGNAPWPIGATMVGIHARPGRERIASKHVAHVLNDETQRKYIQAVKRLISKSQQYFPTDPSRCVEYGVKNENITIIPK